MDTKVETTTDNEDFREISVEDVDPVAALRQYGVNTTKEPAVDYMILINSDESIEGPMPGTPEFDEFMGGWMAYNQRLIDGGHWISGCSLQPGATATTVRKSAGAAPTMTDGPFVETKEQIGGFYLVSAKDLDEALELAAAIPIDDGALEVRPVMFRPDAT